jgi:hypothetical protein
MRRFLPILAILFFISSCVLDNEPRPLIHAVPSNAAFILKSENSDRFFDQLQATNWYQESDSTHLMLNAFKKVELLSNGIFGEARPELSAILSIHRSGANSYDYLVAIDEMQLFAALQEAELDLLALGEVQGKTYEGVRIEHIQNIEKDLDVYFFRSNGIIVMTSSAILAELSIRHLHQEANLLTDVEFRYLYERANEKEDVQIFLQFEELPDLTERFFELPDTRWTGQLSRWMGMDLDLKEDRLLGSGLVVSSDTSMNFLNVFAKSPPQAVQVQKVLPRNTAFFLDYGMENFRTFQRDFKKYLHRYNREETLTKLEENEVLHKAFTSWVDNEIALCITETERSDLSENTYAIMRARDVDMAVEMLQEVDDPTKRTEYRGQNLGFIDKKVLPMLLGKAFTALDQTWFVALNEYVVFAHSEAALKVFINDFVSGRTLSKSEKFNNRLGELNARSNVFLYADNPKALSVLRGKIDREVLSSFDEGVYPILGSIDGLILQLRVEEEAAFAQLLIEYRSVDESETRMLWMAELDTSAMRGPQLLKNHYTRQKEVLVQDIQDQLYLFSPEGELLWKRDAEGQILGKAHQVDMFRNGKLQLVFNTEEMIYVIDRNGENVEPWPIHAPSKCTAPMAVFDYDNRRAYRLLVPCGTKILNYDLDGNIVQGWGFTESMSDITHEPQLFQVAGKDFIIFREFNGSVSILNRKGEVRLPIREEMDLTENPFYLIKGMSLAESRLVTSDEGGNLVSIFLGGNIDRLEMETLLPGHQLIIRDEHFFVLNGDVLDISGPIQNYSAELGGKAQWFDLFEIKGENYPGLVVPEMKQVLLFDDGELLEGMPMFGDSPFVIGDLKNSGQPQLLVLDTEGILYAYLLDL